MLHGRWHLVVEDSIASDELCVVTIEIHAPVGLRFHLLAGFVTPLRQPQTPAR
jgi:hypothetical protein